MISAPAVENLSYLQQFPLDAIKIDQSFVHRITSFPGGTSIVSAIIGLGQSLNLRVVAEGVETVEEMAFLKAQSCDEAQGDSEERSQPINSQR